MGLLRHPGIINEHRYKAETLLLPASDYLLVVYVLSIYPRIWNDCFCHFSDFGNSSSYLPLRQFNSCPAWSLIMFGLAAGYKAAISAVLLNVLLLLAVFSGAISDVNHFVRHILEFSAFIVFPITAIYSLRIIRSFTLKIPSIIKWVQLIFIESIVVILAATILISSVQITLMARIPKPYVIYIAVAFIFLAEFVNMLHSQSPRLWYDAFFKYRNLIYLPILLMGCASLYVEFSIVGILPRTLVASAYVLWLLILSVCRMFSGCAGFINAKNQAMFFHILFICTFFLSFFFS